MALRGWLIAGSLAAHGIMVVALGGLRAPAEILATAIEVTETKKAEPPPPPPPVDPPEPPKAPEPKQVTKPAAKAAEAPPPDVAPPEAPAPMAGLPDFGLELSGGTGGGNGLAMPRGGGEAKPTKPAPSAVQKTFEKAAPAPKPVDACDEGPAKPKLLNLPQPAYTDAARAAGVEGKVRVQLTVDETGKVIEAKTLTSLGHGLDEAALAAAKAATFEPAMRCGKPSKSSFTIAIRFAAS